jgi:hypothetical protein
MGASFACTLRCVVFRTMVIVFAAILACVSSGRRAGASEDLVTAGEAAESRLTDQTRDVIGASFYWVMDLAGSVWERVVTFGHPRGRAFRGTHGDGRITQYGQATNEVWPLGDAEPAATATAGAAITRRGCRRGHSIRTTRSPIAATDRGEGARARSLTASAPSAPRPGRDALLPALAVVERELDGR